MPVYRSAYLGASGRIGRLLRAAERRERAGGVASDRVQMFWQYRQPQPMDDHAFHWPDFSDPAPFLAACRDIGLDSLIVFAGATGDKQNVEAMQVNVRLADQAIVAAVGAGVKRLLVASSSAVYGAGHGAPLREGDSRAPVTAYGEAKGEVEALCAQRAAMEGLEICALRIGNVAGADMLLCNAMAPQNLQEPLHLDIFPDGRSPLRSYIGPVTLLKLLQALSVYPGTLPEILNLAGTVPVEMADLLDAAGVAWVGRACSDAGLRRITLDCTALAALCPDVDLDVGAGAIVAEWQAIVQDMEASV